MASSSEEKKTIIDPIVAPESVTPSQESSDRISGGEETLKSQQEENSADGQLEEEGNLGGEAEDEEEGECGFCLFMKGGGCKEVFIDWEKCIEEGEKNKEDIVNKCYEATVALKKCMDAHPDYYEPVLRAEKAAEAEAVEELEKEKESLVSGDSKQDPPLQDLDRN